MPKAKPTLAGQEHQSYDYVRNASLNTAATVDITLDLPSNTFDAYYLKIDPRAKDYVQSVTAIYADGTKRTRSGQEILYEANESNADGSFVTAESAGQRVRTCSPRTMPTIIRSRRVMTERSRKIR